MNAYVVWKDYYDFNEDCKLLADIEESIQSMQEKNDETFN